MDVSSYFDELSRRVRALREQYKDDDQFVAAVADVEATVIRTVSLATGDREFPGDLREKIQSTIAVNRIHSEGHSRGDENIRVMQYSLLFEELHSRFHEVASRRHETRFGMLSDNPEGIVRRRDDHDAGRD